ncbi:hypothetical protein Sango_0369300 [Sesamum angolense]|uniref:Uncharacterized protein n=1 Tax=Sesamum angolense TaxID=2727404 RepID=A0AAE2C3R0_9LAMI|nr:hypothetical protein Sango_0369300 [Sesamum angolense]
MASTYCYFLVAAILLQSYRIVVAESIQGCGGFVEASSALIKSRKPTDGKLDYSHVTVELQTLDGLVKDRTQCAPMVTTLFQFMTRFIKRHCLILWDEGKDDHIFSLDIRKETKGEMLMFYMTRDFLSHSLYLVVYLSALPNKSVQPSPPIFSTELTQGTRLLNTAERNGKQALLGRMWSKSRDLRDGHVPQNKLGFLVPVIVDHAGCNANEDINFRFTGFTLSGRVVGAVSGDSCSHKNGGPANVSVKLLSPSGDVASSVSTTSAGSYSFKNIIPGKYKISASRHDLNIDIKGSDEVLPNMASIIDIKAVSYDICGSAQTVSSAYKAKPINLKGQKYLLKGHINVESNENLPESISLDILNNEETLVDGTIARLVSTEIDQSRTAVYEYSVWANLGEKLVFVPRDSRNDVGKKILFYPRQQHELTPAPVYPLVVGVSVIALFISMPRLKDLYQALVGMSMSGSSATAKKDVKKLAVRKKTY